MINDISIHFTLKDQSIEDLKALFYESPMAEQLSREQSPALAVHHCFLTREEVKSKGFATDIHDFLDEISDVEVNWSKTGADLNTSRMNMLINLGKLDGLAIFIGEIRDGVETEYAMAQQAGVTLCHIFVS